MKAFVSRTSAFLVLLLVGGGLSHSAWAQLQKVEQTIFGMDCAPCAHAMEQGIGSMEGVETVSVSLNDGLATIDLSKTNEVTYRDIRTTISNGGFAAKEAILEVKGTLRQKGDRWILEMPGGEQFMLRANEEEEGAKDGLRDLRSEQQVIVMGQIPASLDTDATHWPLRVQQVRSAT